MLLSTKKNSGIYLNSEGEIAWKMRLSFVKSHRGKRKIVSTPIVKMNLPSKHFMGKQKLGAVRMRNVRFLQSI